MTRMRGTSSVTYLDNYSAVSSAVTNIGNKILDSFSAAIGNIVYDKTAEADDHQKKVFWSMDLFSYLFGSFVAAAYFCLFQPFITLWLGDWWLLPMAYVFWFCLNEYVGWNHRMLGSYRAVLGHFEQDQWFMVASGVSNLVLSFVLVIPFGLAGVTAATVFAHCLMWLGRAKVVFGGFMRGCGGRYLRVQLCTWPRWRCAWAAATGCAACCPGASRAWRRGCWWSAWCQTPSIWHATGFLRTPSTCAAVRPSCGGASAGRGRNRWQRWAFYTSAPANTRCSGRIFTAPSAKSFCGERQDLFRLYRRPVHRGRRRPRRAPHLPEGAGLAVQLAFAVQDVCGAGRGAGKDGLSVFCQRQPNLPRDRHRGGVPAPAGQGRAAFGGAAAGLLGQEADFLHLRPQPQMPGVHPLQLRGGIMSPAG